MNGVHDMGGQHGHGPVVAEPDEPVFHERWEGRVYALMRLARRAGIFNLDEMRRTIEGIPATDYLEDSYYERWLAAIERLVAEKHLGSAAERFSGANPKDDTISAPRFAAGDRVRTRNFNPRHHTRLPRYARDRAGVVEAVHAKYVLPDVNAHITGPEDPRRFEHLYTVVFDASELWGDDGGARDKVTLDLSESYLAHEGGRAG